MKKIAINFSGALRSFEYCADSIMNNIVNELRKEYDIYMFGHFWILKEVGDMEYSMKWKIDYKNSFDRVQKFGFNDYCVEEYNQEWEKKIISGCYGNIVLDEYEKIENKEEKMNYKSYAVNSMGMYFKILECQKLMEEYEIANNIKVDYVIRMRPDFYWNEKFPLNIVKKITNNDILLVKDSYCVRAKWMGNDKFFMGTSSVMKKYSRAYEKIKYFFDNKIRIEGQNIAKYYIEDLKLNILFFGDEKTYDKATGKFIKQLLVRNKKLSSDTDQ
ncbi:hypothetical protein Catovirus_1_782 [Catovirus CTV1]|uniref:Uncharacterized protein n=1 Tax=Catovirus CTV1 TaxID=1977631 RepID=A0A1V0SAJ1_9VIRU|nr:hypothetical protein Catovirus_1_782 [Catovirus CTV1]